MAGQGKRLEAERVMDQLTPAVAQPLVDMVDGLIRFANQAA